MSGAPRDVGPGVPPTMRREAACWGKSPDLWFPERYGVREVAQAKAICGACPVKDDCLAWALVHERHGVQGGLTPIERGALGGVTYCDNKYRKRVGVAA